MFNNFLTKVTSFRDPFTRSWVLSRHIPEFKGHREFRADF